MELSGGAVVVLFVFCISIVCGFITQALFLSDFAPWPVYFSGPLLWLLVFVRDQAITGKFTKHSLPNDDLADISLARHGSKRSFTKQNSRSVLVGFLLGILLNLFLPQGFPVIGFDSNIDGDYS